MPDNLVITSYNYIIEKTIDNPKKSILIEVDDYNNVYDVSNTLESKYDLFLSITTLTLFNRKKRLIRE